MGDTNQSHSPRVVLLGAVFVFLGFILALALFKFLTNPKKPLSTAIPSSLAPQVQQPVQSPPEVEQEEPEAQDLTAETAEVTEEEVKQPIAIEETVERKIPQLVLNGIFASETGSYCLINNRIVREGESILGVKVVRIDANKVVLDASGEEMILRVK